MNGSAKIQPRHLQRQAVVYLRQSSPTQVRHNQESAINQRALRERLLELGWKKEQIVIVEDDQGTSAKHVDGRDTFQRLTGDIRGGRIGILMGYEVSRLSRDGADWQRLLKVCAVYDTLVGDSAGIYHPREFNDKLLLDLKGTMSEAELHSLRLRLGAGRLSKAKRGDLSQQLPTGLVRTPAGVVFDPDQSVPARIRLVFRKFPELGSRQKVLHYFVQRHYGKAYCQALSGSPVDEAVVAEFFKALSVAQIDALEEVSRRQAEHQQELRQHLQQEVVRLDYAAQRAERQYNCDEPENRLIAATLEERWEQALLELEQAKGHLAAAQESPAQPLKIARELRRAFADAGRRLPELWPRLRNEAKKSLLRTLVSGVNVLRHEDGLVQLRIVWCGGLVTETSLRLPVQSLKQAGLEKEIVPRIQQLAEEGLANDAIALRLNEEGFHPCRGEAFTEQIILKLKARFCIEHKLAKVRRGNLPTGYTVREMARLVKVDPSWIYRAISVGKIEVSRDPDYACYLFPRQDDAVEAMRELKEGKRDQVSFREVQ